MGFPQAEKRSKWFPFALVFVQNIVVTVIWPRNAAKWLKGDEFANYSLVAYGVRNQHIPFSST